MLNTISVIAGLWLALATPPTGYEQGVVLRVYTEGRIADRLTDPEPARDLRAVFLTPNIDFRDQDAFGGFEDHFRAEVTGAIVIENPGRYEFALISDDGSDFEIDGQRVISNDGLHSAQQANGMIDLDKGLHSFRVRFFESGGDEVLVLRWRPPGQSDMTRLPDRLLVVRADESGSNAPGIRSLVGPAQQARPGLQANPQMFLPPEVSGERPTKASVIPSGAFKSQFYLGGTETAGVRRVQFDEINGVVQGALYQSNKELDAGGDQQSVATFGRIYLGEPGEHRRLEPGRTSIEIRSTHAVPGGFEIRFAEPVKQGDLESRDSYRVEQWCYVPTRENPAERRELEQLQVSQAKGGDDGSSVTLMIPGLKPGRVVHLSADVRRPGDEAKWSSEAWYTLNEMPSSPEHPAPDLRVLVFSKTAGFRHSSIPDGIQAIRELGGKYGFDVHATEDAKWFNAQALSAYDAVIFLSTTGDVLNDEQQSAFEQYIQSGGGYVGVHAASDTEYEWPWYGRLVGAYFLGHPAIQDAIIRVLDRGHIATNMLPADWPRRDEWYNFRAKPGNVDILAELDETTYSGGAMNNDHPVVWCHEFDGGRAFYTAGGHTEESFRESLFLRHLAGGIYWVAGRTSMPE